MFSTRAFLVTSLFFLFQYYVFTQWYQCSPLSPVTESMAFPSPISLPLPVIPPLPAIIQPADDDISHPPLIPQRRHRIAVATTYSPHMDVYMSLAWTLQRVMDHNPPGGTVEVYAPPFPYDFQTVVEQLGLYRGVVKKPDAFMDAINDNIGDDGVDTVVLGTCEMDLKSAWGENLISAWDARDAEHKFTAICLVHNGPENTPQQIFESFSRRNAIRVLTISSHVAFAHRRSFLERADSPDFAARAANYEFIPVDVYVPVLNMPLLQIRNEENPRRILSNAVIQGNFDRRDNTRIFADLVESLSGTPSRPYFRNQYTSLHPTDEQHCGEDPRVWGYLPLDPTNATAAYVADLTLAKWDDEPPFLLWLVGSGPLPEIPHELKNIVQIRSRLAYPDFYALIGSMDVVVPALPRYNAYYDAKASSTFALALECNVPVLATIRLRASYAHIDDDRATITRPASMHEVDALRALRTSSSLHSLQKTGILTNSPAGKAVEDMMRLGWVRSAEDIETVKKWVWEANERVVDRILKGVGWNGV